MLINFCIIFIGLEVLNALYLSDYEEITHKNYMQSEEIEFEPVTVLSKEKEKYISSRNINCDDFSKFALNCTIEAAFIYNSTRISPPMPHKMADWCKLLMCETLLQLLNKIFAYNKNTLYPTFQTHCLSKLNTILVRKQLLPATSLAWASIYRAIKHLVNCAIDWNAECKDVTQDHFNEEGIKGHIHVIRSACDDEWFLTRYMDLTTCIENKASIWEACYSTFKDSVELEKNTTNEWTHYDTHFNLCCARAKFRRCTLGSLFRLQTNCSYENAVTLQKFSVIISEGAVYQDCERNMMYSNCPGGDPRPSRSLLGRLMSSDAFNKACSLNTKLWSVLLILASICFDLVFTNKNI